MNKAYAFAKFTKQRQMESNLQFMQCKLFGNSELVKVPIFQTSITGKIFLMYSSKR